MKLFNGFTYSAILFLALSILLFSQTTQEFAFKDSVGNSQIKKFRVDVTHDLDSVNLSLYSQGEIDLDTLGVKFGVNGEFKYKEYRQKFEYLSGKNTTYSKVLTVNLDSAVVNYPDTPVVSIPLTAFRNYNFIEFYLVAASSGNDPTDPQQKAVAIITKFKKK
jgi:hypothetical protein